MGILSRIIGPSYLSDTAATLYTVPGSKRVTLRDIHLSNGDHDLTRRFTLSVGTDDPETRIYDAIEIMAGGTVQRTGAITLEDGEIVQGFADVADTVVVVINAYVEDV